MVHRTNQTACITKHIKINASTAVGGGGGDRQSYGAMPMAMGVNGPNLCLLRKCTILPYHMPTGTYSLTLNACHILIDINSSSL